MFPVKTILHPTDFSESAFQAFPLACVLARDYGARLVVLHVAPLPMAYFGEGHIPPDPQQTDQALLNKLHRLWPPDPDVAVEHQLERGETVPQILAAARETNADLIVLGTHGRRGVARLLLGSVAEQVLRRSPCPVLTVRGPLPGTGPVEGPAGGTADLVVGRWI